MNPILLEQTEQINFYVFNQLEAEGYILTHKLINKADLIEIPSKFICFKSENPVDLFNHTQNKLICFFQSD